MKLDTQGHIWGIMLDVYNLMSNPEINSDDRSKLKNIYFQLGRIASSDRQKVKGK